MSLVETFKKDPTSRSNFHKLYQDSMFITHAPEYSTSEVLMGSAYRRLLLGISDKDVDLLNIPLLEQSVAKSLGSSNLASRVLSPRRGLGSPLRSGQHGSIPLRQLMPLVPETARNACVLGKVRNRWFPGSLLLETIASGVGVGDAEKLAHALGNSLEVNASDDLMARFIEQLLKAHSSGSGEAPAQVKISSEEARSHRGKASDSTSPPSERFCKDLASVIELKPRLTRRQWTVLVEAMLRLGLPAHVLWVCRAASTYWNMCLDACAGRDAPSVEDIDRRIWLSGSLGVDALEVGRDGMPALKSILEQYLYARFGLNLLLAQLEDNGKPWVGTLGFDPTNGNLTAFALRDFLNHVFQSRSSVSASDPVGWLNGQCSDLLDKQTSLVRCSAGFTKNMLEFVRHSLGQIEAQDPERSSYDQSYFLTNETRARSRSSQWPVQLGPAMLIVLAYACSKSHGDIPVSVEDLRHHLHSYGVGTPAGELSSGRMGRDLQNLGLVVDSPDAAGGRLLVRPF